MTPAKGRANTMVAVCTAWTPPMRLHRHVAQCTGLHRGLCPPLRGVACSTERYYALLAGANSLRRGDLDGRGNLNKQVLVSSADDVLFSPAVARDTSGCNEPENRAFQPGGSAGGGLPSQQRQSSLSGELPS